MGLAASQGKLLFMTARLSNNEFEQQAIAYAKQRLSDSTEGLNDKYLEALKKTKYQVLTGYNGSDACYQNVTYAQITGMYSRGVEGTTGVATGKQYIMKTNTGKVLVTNEVAKAFEAGNGDYNTFLKKLGLTSVNVDYRDYDVATDAIHEAWDKYLVSIGRSINDNRSEHILNFGYKNSQLYKNDENGNDTGFGVPTYKSATVTFGGGTKLNLYKDDNGYYTLNSEVFPVMDENDGTSHHCAYYPPNSEDTPIELSDKVDILYHSDIDKYVYNGASYEKLYAGTSSIAGIVPYITPDVKNYVADSYGNKYAKDQGGNGNNNISSVTITETPLLYEGATVEQRELYDAAVAVTAAFVDPDGQEGLKYDTQQVSFYKNIFREMSRCGYTTAEKMNFKEINLKEDEWLVRQLKSGNLRMYYYSAAEKQFIGTTLDDDESIVEKEDKAAINIAEREYQNKLDVIESQEKQLDMQLNKLEAEHNALQTEYDSVKKVISENVKQSFNIFS